ncbi:MAG: hypothetical protein ACYC4H_12300 [Desulfocucumaceae bacterium]
MNWNEVKPEWISAFAATAAAMFAFIATLLAGKSIKQQSELVKASIRPVLGLTEAQALPPRKDLGYPVHLCFTNYGQGAAWLLKVENKSGDIPIETHISTPVCTGPGSNVGVTVFLPQRDKDFNIDLAIFYWDVNDTAHCTTVKPVLAWVLNVNPIEKWEIINERAFHELPYKRPTEVQHQPGQKKEEPTITNKP